MLGNWIWMKGSSNGAQGGGGPGINSGAGGTYQIGAGSGWSMAVDYNNTVWVGGGKYTGLWYWDPVTRFWHWAQGGGNTNYQMNQWVTQGPIHSRSLLMSLV
jgi:hypothetical protein